MFYLSGFKFRLQFLMDNRYMDNINIVIMIRFSAARLQSTRPRRRRSVVVEERRTVTQVRFGKFHSKKYQFENIL